LGATRMFGPDAIEGGPTIAMFQDPDGNMIGLVNGSPDDAPMMTGGGAPVSWFEIAGKDASKTQDFYRKLFDWEINADNPIRYGEVAHVGNGIGGGVHAVGDSPGTTIYVQVDDLDEALAKVNELGGKTVQEPADVPGGPKIAQFTDPAGNQIGLLLTGSFGSNN
jgi:uncharacterized protein